MQGQVVGCDQSVDRSRHPVVEQRDRFRTQWSIAAGDGDRDLLDGDVGAGVRAIAEEEDIVRFLLVRPRHHACVDRAGKARRIDGGA